MVRSLRTQPDLLQAMAAAAAAEGEEARHREALAELADHQVLAASLGTWHLRLPHLTFAAALTLHGSRRRAEAPATTRAYLADMQRRARAFRAAGGTPEQAGALPVPPEYAGWGAPRVFGLNMCEFCGRG